MGEHVLQWGSKEQGPDDKNRYGWVGFEIRLKFRVESGDAWGDHVNCEKSKDAGRESWDGNPGNKSKQSNDEWRWWDHLIL